MAKKMWGGRFKKKIDPDFEGFSSSIHADYRLAEYDVLGSIIHITVLKDAGFIKGPEYNKLYQALDVIYSQIKKNEFEPCWKCEDIHSDIQNRVEKLAGNIALKLQTWRSRNDQVVFDTKFFCKCEISGLNKLVLEVEKSILNFSRKNVDVYFPGYTHLQHAQPIRMGEYVVAYQHMLDRDAHRLENVDKGLKISLGSGAFAGTVISSYKYNAAARQVLARYGFKGMDMVALENSVENVSDRDFVIELLNVLAIIGMHLSRMAEDFILWSTKEFGFIELGDEFCTGSSLMPQKKNPDALELIRGNTGLLYGNLVAVLTTMKGLPLAYNRDMQMDKIPLFSSVDIIKSELKIMAKLIPTIKISKANIAKQLEDESLYATDLADYLVKNGLPFKTAHDVIGRLVKKSIDNDIKISQMADKELKQISPYLSQCVVKKVINPEYSVNSKKSILKKKI